MTDAGGDLVEHRERQLARVGLTHRESGLGGPLEEQLTSDAGETPAGEGRSHELAVTLDEHVGAGPLAQLADGVGEQRLIRTLPVRLGERHDVLGVGDGLEPRDCRSFVADPRDPNDA
jgi:hypothetical protein